MPGYPVIHQCHMLFYPAQYEGQECSPNIFYTGATPNQQIEPAVDWLLRYKGSKFFLVGSDYVFPRTANEIIRHRSKLSAARPLASAASRLATVATRAQAQLRMKSSM